LLQLTGKVGLQFLPDFAKQGRIATPSQVNRMGAGTVLEVQNFDGLIIAGHEDLAKSTGENVIPHGSPPACNLYQGPAATSRPGYPSFDPIKPGRLTGPTDDIPK